MKIAGVIVAAVLIVFAWKGSELELSWPPAGTSKNDVPPKPAPELLVWADGVGRVLPKMTPPDRRYMATFYEALAFVIMRDGDRESPIISDTDKFVALHAGSLRLAIDRKDVGKYDGLGEAIDETFIKAAGADPKKLDKETRGLIVAACGVLSWTFSIHGE